MDAYTRRLLNDAYGRSVPEHVRLLSDFDAPSGCQSKPGDIVVVAFPPDGVEVDECSLFVMLDTGDENPSKERVYEYEFEVVGD